VEIAACHEVVITGDDLRGPGKGMDALPVPISTPGYDCAPYRRRDDVPTSLG